MSTTSEILPSPPNPAAVLEFPNLPDPETPPRRPKGKIANLPKEQRDSINRLLHEGATYGSVVDQMAKQGVSLNTENISNWYKAGFQEYLAQLERLDYHRATYEAAADVLENTDTARLPEASLQTAAAHIFDLLGKFSPASLARNMSDDPAQYTRLLNALSRITRESLTIKKYRDACVRARAVLEELKDPRRKLTESERHALIRHVDDLLGVACDESEPDDLTPKTRPTASAAEATPQPPAPESANGSAPPYSI